MANKRISSIKISLASRKDILDNSFGNVTSIDTYIPGKDKPHEDGLLSQRIFGPVKDWECACNPPKKQKIARPFGKEIRCQICNVPFAKSDVRRKRAGHVDLEVPVVNILFLHSGSNANGGFGSVLSVYLDLDNIENVIYSHAEIVLSVDKEAIEADFPKFQKKVKDAVAALKADRDAQIDARQKKLEEDLAKLAGGKTTAVKNAAEREIQEIKKTFLGEIARLEQPLADLKKLEVGSVIEWGENLGKAFQFAAELKEEYGEYFESAKHAAGLKKYIELDHMQPAVLREAIVAELETTKTEARRAKLRKRLRLVNMFIESEQNPADMFLTAVPVIPADLRPLYLPSAHMPAVNEDVNSLYKKIIERNDSLRQSNSINFIAEGIDHATIGLQNAVDELISNGTRGHSSVTQSGKAHKSIVDYFTGKNSITKQRMIGKRVDYSARSVIVVGPELHFHQCGIPKEMALDLFNPFVVAELVKAYGLDQKKALDKIEAGDPEIWDALERAVEGKYVLLNRAPSLHRLSFQAFEPVLVEGKAIQLHPLVCTAFNADFDGDTMAVHLPLTPEAQTEAKILMLSSSNIIKPSDGSVIITPTQDIISGVYYLTRDEIDSKTGAYKKIEDVDVKTLQHFSSIEEVHLAYDFKSIDVNQYIRVRSPKDGSLVVTTYGRLVFNNALPEDYEFVNETVSKKFLSNILVNMVNHYSSNTISDIVDKIKELGFRWSTKAGVTFSLQDVVDVAPDTSTKVLAAANKKEASLVADLNDGILSESEYSDRFNTVWSEAQEELHNNVTDQAGNKTTNPLYLMIDSGARGNWDQVVQMAGMRGLVQKFTTSRTIESPVKSSYLTGVNSVEYYVNSHWGRTGLLATSSKTAESGENTHNLVTPGQQIVISENDCKSPSGITKEVSDRSAVNKTSFLGRFLVSDAVDAKGKVVIPADKMITEADIETLTGSTVESAVVRSPFSCASESCCAKCYGRSFADGKDIVAIGAAVGIVAGQSIGEFTTQATMNTRHGATAVDVLGIVKRVFSAQSSLSQAQGINFYFSPFAKTDGKVKVEKFGTYNKIEFIPSDDVDESVREKVSQSYAFDNRLELSVKDGQEVKQGDTFFVDGQVNLQSYVKYCRGELTFMRILNECQTIFRQQGFTIQDVHFELIAREMLKFVYILDPGDSEYIVSQVVNANDVKKRNAELVANGKAPIKARPSIVKVLGVPNLGTSWVYAQFVSSFKQVITERAVRADVDKLTGVAENHIVGNRAPIGTGIPQLLNSTVDCKPEAIERFASLMPESIDDEFLPDLDFISFS